VPKVLVLIGAIVMTALLTIVNFINLKSIPQVGLGYEDKLYHVGVYMVFSFLWAYWSLLYFKKNVIFITGLSCLFYGILLEILQNIVNPSRTFDMLDLLSNCLGVVFGIVIAAFWYKQNVKLN
jgi:VanZ family protein